MTLEANTLKERAARAVNNLVVDDGHNLGAVFLEAVRHIVNTANDDGLIETPLARIVERTVTSRPIARRLVQRVQRENIVRTEDGKTYLVEPSQWSEDVQPRDLHPYWTERRGSR